MIGIYILRSLHRGPTHLRHMQWNLNSNYQHATTYTHLLQGRVKQLRSAKRHCSSCSMRIRETHSRRSQRKNCKQSYPLLSCLAKQMICFTHRFNRNWRFNKDLRLWLTKEQRSTKTLENGLGEVGTFTYWDPENWEKSRKEFTVMYSDLEDKSTPAFTGPTLQPTVVSAQQQQQIQAAQVQVQAQQPRAFGGLSMTAAAM